MIRISMIIIFAGLLAGCANSTFPRVTPDPYWYGHLNPYYMSPNYYHEPYHYPKCYREPYIYPSCNSSRKIPRSCSG